MREVLDFLSTDKGIHDPIDVRLRQLIVVCDLDTLIGSINEPKEKEHFLLFFLLTDFFLCI